MLGSSSAISTRAAISGGPAQAGFTHQWKRERETRALPRPAGDPQAPAAVLDDAPADVQAEPAALRLAGERIAGLPELVEDDLLVLGPHAGSVVAHVHPQEPVFLGKR